MKKTFLTSLLLVILIFAPLVNVSAKASDVHSIDEKIAVEVTEKNGMATYSVKYDGVTFIEPSALGVVTNFGDFSKEVTMRDCTINSIDEHYSLRNIKQSDVQYKANEMVCGFYQNEKHVFDVIFRVSNRDVAFCYKIYTNGAAHSCVILHEKSEFRLPQGTTSFLCPQSKPMGGFASTSPSYETPYTLDDEIGKNGWGEGYTFPCLFRNNTNGWLLISETGVSSSYCASRLIGNKDGSYAIGFPQEGECNGLGSVSPGLSLPGVTPWRTITLGSTLANIVETTASFDLVKPLYSASKEYTYGKGSWSWIIGMDNSCNFDEQKRYIDFSAAMGYQTVLIDALWDVQIGRERIAELARYGATKGVSLFLWYNSNGYWNDAFQSPRGIMDNEIVRRKEMAWMKSIGIKGIKVDFFGGDKQNMMQVYEGILTDANDYGIQVIFHGCTIPRGWERMYPNYVASEAVLASENMHFSQGSCDAEAVNACLHPFIRNTIGSMDFGGSTLNKYYNADNKSGNHRITSDVFALATSVLFQSGIQHFALAPNNLTDAPDWAIQFMKTVPSTWDEVKYIDGYPGRYVIIARRHGDNWYVAGVNAQQETLKLKIALPMFKSGERLSLYSDDNSLTGSLKTIKQRSNQIVTLVIPQNGGVVIKN